MISTDDILTVFVHHDDEEELRKKEAKAESALYSTAQKTINDCGIQIIGSEGGKVKVWSSVTHAISDINLDTVKYPSMLSLGGAKFKQAVQPDTFIDFVQALALSAASVRSRDNRIIGTGIWGMRGRNQEETSRIVLVKQNKCYEIEKGDLTEKPSPRFDNVYADIREAANWFSSRLLRESLKKGQKVKWRQRAHNQLLGYVQTWIWKRPEMAELACGLIYASWIQTLWPWRPTVALIGGTNSGKSYFLERILQNLLPNLVTLSADVTAAGIAHTVQHTAPIIAVDEFDRNPHRKAIFSLIRGSSRKTKRLRGSAAQKALSQSIQHMIWLIGIYANSYEAADKNRIILLELEKTKQRTIKVPAPQEAYQLGHDLLGSILNVAHAAVEASQELGNSLDEQQIDTRYRESFAVPYAILGQLQNEPLRASQEKMEKYLAEYVTPGVVDEGMQDTDEEQMLHDLLTTVVPRRSYDYEDKTVADILFSDDEDEQRSLEARGITTAVHENTLYAVFNPQQITSEDGIMRGEWRKNAGMHQLFSRLSGPLKPIRIRVYMRGTRRRVFAIPMDSVKEWA